MPEFGSTLHKVNKAKLVAHMRGAIEAVLTGYLGQPVCEYTAQNMVHSITSVFNNYLFMGNGSKPTFEVVNTTTPFEMDQNHMSLCLHINWGDGGETHLTTQMVTEGTKEAVEEAASILVETLQRYGYKVAGKI